MNLSYSRANAGQLTAENTQSYGYDGITRLTSARSATRSYDNADRLT